MTIPQARQSHFVRAFVWMIALSFFALAACFSTCAHAQSLKLTAVVDGGAYTTEVDGAPDAKTMAVEWSMFRGKRGDILGVHTLEWRRESKRLVVGAILISNGAANADGTGFCGEVFYSKLIATPSREWSIVWLDLALPSSADSMPANFGIVRRFALHRDDVTPRQAWTAIDAVPAFDRKQPFGPAGFILPEIDVAAQEKRFAPAVRGARAALLAGQPYTLAPGDFQGTQGFPGNREPMEPGGKGIVYAAGYEQAPSAARWYGLLTDAWLMRQRVHAYHKVTGRLLTTDDWTGKRAEQPFWTYLHGQHGAVDQYAPRQNGPRHTWAPAAYDVPAFNTGPAPKRAERESYASEAGSHWIRVLSVLVARYELTGDPVARHGILICAQWARTSYSDRGTLRKLLTSAKARPHSGSMGREFGNAVLYQAACALMVLAPDDPMRPGVEAWARMALELHATVAMPSGLVQRAVSDKNPKPLLGTYDAPTMWTTSGLPTKYDGTRTFEWCINTIGALACMRELGILTPKDGAPIRHPSLTAIVRAATNLLKNPALAPRSYDGNTQWGPPNSIAVAPYGGVPFETITIGAGGGDPAHVEIVIAELARIDPTWIDLLPQFGWRAATLEAKAKKMAELVASPPVSYQAEWVVQALSGARAAIEARSKQPK